MHRDSSETSFLAQGLNNLNLKVHLLTLAKQILFDSNQKATSVRDDTAGIFYVLSARNEMILTSGAFSSPHLLMISGVGPAATLKGLNVPVVADRPAVGQGMQDHMWYEIAYRINGITFTELANNPAFAAEQAKLYNDQAAGLYTSPGTDVLAWEKIPSYFRHRWSNQTRPALAAYLAN